MPHHPPTQTRLSRAQRLEAIDLYPVLSSEFTCGRSVLEVLAQIASGGARIVQLREKAKTKREVFELAVAYRKVCDKYSMLLIVNDHVDVALAAGADGVHLGQDDLPVSAARAIAPDLLLGASTHSREEALEAQAAGADYVNLGPIYPTATKLVPTGVVGIQLIKEVAPLLHIPFTVMGGIKEHHLPELLAAGARRIAMVTEITQADDVAVKVRVLRSHFPAG